MDLGEFAALHLPALEADEVRFNLQIAVITSAVKERPADFRHWALGAPGHCAIQWPGRPIVLGNLDRSECRELAQAVGDIDYPGVVGADQTAPWFVEDASRMGAHFEHPIPQRIHALSAAPRYPGVPGSARAADAGDAPLLHEWLVAFHREAVPQDPPPERANVERAIADRRFLIWMADGTPVSLAGIARRSPHAGAIAPVFTPPQQRCRGYAGSATAAVADRLFAEGKTAVCLYTDLRNPGSNRCYAKIGFTPHCDSRHYVRRAGTVHPDGSSTTR